MHYFRAVLVSSSVLPMWSTGRLEEGKRVVSENLLPQLPPCILTSSFSTKSTPLVRIPFPKSTVSMIWQYGGPWCLGAVALPSFLGVYITSVVFLYSSHIFAHILFIKLPNLVSWCIAEDSLPKQASWSFPFLHLMLTNPLFFSQMPFLHVKRDSPYMLNVLHK